MKVLQEPDEALNALSKRVIGAAIAVHRELGPGYPESVYERAMCVELTSAGIPFVSQHRIAVMYRDVEVGEGRLDMLVEDRLILEFKAVDKVLEVHSAQVLSYLKTTHLLLGLLINFNCLRLADGIERIVHGGR